VNLLADSGTVLHFNTLHAVLVNPNYRDAVIPFGVCENLDYNGDQYEEFFQDVIRKIHAADLDVVAVIQSPEQPLYPSI
jgi:hypothetical protein